MPFLRDPFSREVDLTQETTMTLQTPTEKGAKMSGQVDGPTGMWKTDGEINGAGEAMDGVLPTSSQPPTPPESRSPTPRVTLMPCPVRLLPLVPAPNYGCVALQKIYRSAFPQARHIEFIENLKVKSILTLVTKTESCEVYDDFVWQNNIRRLILDVEPNKEGKVRSNFDTLCEAILFAINPAHHPVWIHCNQGRHRTGCVVACIRKIQQWPMDEIIDEYRTYAHPKPRDGDIELIKTFDPELVIHYARQNGLLNGFQNKLLGRNRVDSFNSVYELAASLPVHDTALMLKIDASMQEEEDHAILMAMARCASNVAAGADQSTIDPLLTQSPISSTPDVTISEVDGDEEDGLNNSLEVEDGDNEERLEFEDVKIVSKSATTAPIPIRGRY